jgi:uncharacterized YccA/Bax inhibitor family protein
VVVQSTRALECYYKHVLAGSFVCGDNFLLRNFGLYGLIFIYVCLVINVATIMLLHDFAPYGIICMIMEFSRRNRRAV